MPATKSKIEQLGCHWKLPNFKYQNNNKIDFPTSQNLALLRHSATLQAKQSPTILPSCQTNRLPAAGKMLHTKPSF